VHMSESKVPVTCGPLLGEHTEEVLAEWCGMSKEQVAEYVKATPIILKKK
jgi:crotonobetainyl-CoA:carnitine CoA-transferase CaiB-like acyl-CoA transferase